LTSTDPTGLTTTFTYEQTHSKVASITDPLGNVSRFAYDARGNLTTTTDATTNVTSYLYDSNGLITQVIDALQQTTKYGYDGFGNLASITAPLGETRMYGYDPISRLIQVTDALGRRTFFSYDALGRMVTRTNAQGGVTTSTYDPDGNLLLVRDAKGNSTAFAYDSMNRVVSRTDALGKSDTRTWDMNGNLVTYVDRRGVISAFMYDNLNRLTTETYPDAMVARTYDFVGRPVQVNDSAAGIFSFTRDLAGRLISSSTPYGTVNYNYDGRGLMFSRQVVSQPTVTYTYDAAANLISAAMPPSSAAFAYNPRGKLSRVSRLNGVNTSYAYDADARLIGITHSNSASVIDSESYQYDGAGNRVSHAAGSGQPLMTPATTNQFNASNQLVTFGPVMNSYDANGNLVQQGSTVAYTWDARNRLRSIITAAGQTTIFTYDFAGNLIEQADSGTSLNLRRRFVLDDLTDVAYETASDGSFYSVLSGRALDSHLAVLPPTGPAQYGLVDAINSTIAAVDQSGAILSRYAYEPFGQTATGGTYPFQFGGRNFVAPNLSYNRARFYNSQTGRFISEDAVRFLPKDTNLYRYARNNPTLFRDPKGHQAGDGFTIDVSDQTPHGPWPDWPPASLRPSWPPDSEYFQCLREHILGCSPSGEDYPHAQENPEPTTGIPPLPPYCPPGG
jgi:RHS repeat-associated protein